MERRSLLPAALLTAAGTLAYLSSFSVPFLFDDFYHIVDNLRIRGLLHPVQVLTGTTRPLVALSLAVNYAAGGLSVWGYHAFNLAVHLLAGLALFGVIRRTLLNPRSAPRYREQATELALAASLLWLLHPLQTQSVTYVIQRGESLMGLFYLLTLYCVIRGWAGWAVLACALGMLSKPVMVTAPLMVLLYDRIFLSPSWGELFRRRWKLVAGLVATWGILPLVLASGAQEYRGLVGLHLNQASPLAYLLTQPGVILHYLRLSFWPHPLILDYQWPIARSFGQVLPSAIAVGGLLAATFWALWPALAEAPPCAFAERRRPEIGFWGAWFFGILAPTSSFLPIADTAFEHRMYLPLAAVILLSLLGLRTLMGRRPLLFWAVPFLLIPAAAFTTFHRNQLYGDPAAFWADQISHRPDNARGYVNLGAALQTAGRSPEAIEAFRKALSLQPDQADAHNDLAYMLLLQNNLEEAELNYREALRLSPNLAMAHKGMGMLLQKKGRLEEAAAEYTEALRLNPVFSDARVQLGLIRQMQGQVQEAFEQYREALKVNPREPAAYNNIGTLLFRQGKWGEAARFFAHALELSPDYTEARDNLRKTRFEMDRAGK